MEEQHLVRQLYKHAAASHRQPAAKQGRRAQPDGNCHGIRQPQLRDERVGGQGAIERHQAPYCLLGKGGQEYERFEMCGVAWGVAIYAAHG